MLIGLGTLALALALPAGQELPTGREVAAAAAVTKAFSQGLAAADVAAIKGFFAEHVLFAGDLRFVVGGSAGQSHGHLVVTREQLSDAYARLFDRIDQAKWKATLIGAVESLKLAVKDGDHLDDPSGQLPAGFVKAGDYVYELRRPDRTGLDDALLFVIRPLGGKLLIIAHWADY